MELAVYITAHGDGTFYRLNVGLVLKDFAGLYPQSSICRVLLCAAAGSHLFAKPLNIGLGQLLAGHEVFYPAVEDGNGGGVGRCGQGLWHLADILHVCVHSQGMAGARSVGCQGRSVAMVTEILPMTAA